MKERDDTVYLKHILDAITRIEGYLAGVSQETFTKTPLLQDGVMRHYVDVFPEDLEETAEMLAERRGLQFTDIIGNK